MLVGDRRITSREREPLIARNPATGETIAEVPSATAQDVDAAVAAASVAQPDWDRRDPGERAELVRRLADRIEERADELALLDTLDTGSPLPVMRRDAANAVSHMRYLAGLVLEARGETIPSVFDRLIYTIRRPFGVVGRITAFNHPLLFTATRLAAPVLVGNTLVTKPSEHTSLSSLALADDIAEIFPSGVVNVITGSGSEAGDAIVRHPDVRRLAFIGSADTGRRILERSARSAVKSVTLELGGKNPVIVFPDADLDDAVDGVVAGMNFTWQGQSCGSTSRLLVHSSIHAAFVERLGARLAELRVGLPTDPRSDCGAIINEAQLAKVLHYIELGRSDGARLVTGGARLLDGPLADGLFVSPALFDGVDPGSRLAQEEIFGPVLAVIPFEDEQHALNIANGVRYGLTASVYTRDLGTAHRFARELQAGYVWINETSLHLPGTGFGGVKDSGLGREENLEELLSYTTSTNVSVRLPTAHGSDAGS